MKKLLGVVLCGGESKRMGSDKGLLPIKETTWANFAVGKLHDLQIPVVISVNEGQLNDYEKIFPRNLLITDNSTVKGPLKGLLSVHQQYPENDFLLMACDLIDMDVTTLKNLVSTYRKNDGFEYYVYTRDEFTEPFCGVYTSTGLKNVMQKVRTNTLLRFSLQNVLNDGKTLRIPIPDITHFTNYNSL